MEGRIEITGGKEGRESFMKKQASVCCILMFMLFLAACGASFDGSRIGNDSEFSLKYSILNAVDK